MNAIDPTARALAIDAVFDAAGGGAPMSPEDAQTVFALLSTYEHRENTVLGMLAARRPHTEIRDALLARPSGDGT